MNAYSPPVRAYVETDEDRIERDREERWEALREECFDEFTDWQRADYAHREFECFSNWMVNKARWNGGGKYLEALDWSERALVAIDVRRAG